ncbi:MAG: DUF1987 domain-containing protein [Bacteroidota bacterium]
MELHVRPTKTEPLIHLADGVLRIEGRSIPANSVHLYEKVIEMFYTYTKAPRENTEVHINLEYMNSTSNRSLLNLLIVAEKLHEDNKNVNVYWYYRQEDEIIHEQGKIFEELLNLPFSFVVKRD